MSAMESAWRFEERRMIRLPRNGPSRTVRHEQRTRSSPPPGDRSVQRISAAPEQSERDARTSAPPDSSQIRGIRVPRTNVSASVPKSAFPSIARRCWRCLLMQTTRLSGPTMSSPSSSASMMPESARISPCVGVHSCIGRDHLPFLQEEYHHHVQIKCSRTLQTDQDRIRRNLGVLAHLWAGSSEHGQYTLFLKV